MGGGGMDDGDDPAQDRPTMEWPEACIQRLQPFTLGSHIGKADFVRRPATAEEAYRPDCWTRLADWRSVHDSNRLCFDWSEDLLDDDGAATHVDRSDRPRCRAEDGTSPTRQWFREMVGPAVTCRRR